MVAKRKTTNGLIADVAGLYDWLEQQVSQSPHQAGKCKACGRCCDFARFDHHLYVTTAEIIYLKAVLHSTQLRRMKTSVCPYNADGRCEIYQHRFAGCRIFCCTGETSFQNQLSELAMARLKAICAKHQIPYRYADLAVALAASTSF
jgi:Fe-S-cluster containining protein